MVKPINYNIEKDISDHSPQKRGTQKIRQKPERGNRYQDPDQNALNNFEIFGSDGIPQVDETV
jgi:hypothetical protein